MVPSRPIGILDEHPEWSRRLIAALDARGLPFEKIDHSNHAFDPRERIPRYSVIVNRTSSPTVLGFDPFPVFVDFILSVATRGRIAS